MEKTETTLPTASTQRLAASVTIPPTIKPVFILSLEVHALAMMMMNTKMAPIWQWLIMAMSTLAASTETGTVEDASAQGMARSVKVNTTKISLEIQLIKCV